MENKVMSRIQNAIAEATKGNVEQLLEPYVKSQTECDGFTRIATYILTKNKIKHQVFGGTVTHKGNVVSPHFWIVWNNMIIDYRLQMWAGKSAPNGIFKPDKNTVYTGKPVSMRVSDVVFYALTMSCGF